MVQISSFYIKSEMTDGISSAYQRLQKDYETNDLVLESHCVKTKTDVKIDFQKHQAIFEKIYPFLIDEKIEFISKNEYYDDGQEYHENIVFHQGKMQRIVRHEIYEEGKDETKYYFGLSLTNQEEFDEDSWDLEEVMCPECGEYIKKHTDFLFSYCPFCDYIDEDEVIEEQKVEAKWKEYKFETPLGVELPEQLISSGQDWISDCEEDRVFGLNPACYESVNQYNAALRLCRLCAGWYHYESEEEKEKQMSIYKEVLKAKKNEPMYYYDLWQNNFDFITAIKDNNPKYQGKLLDVKDVWTLFSTLQQRSFIEKAECFDWLIEFFGDYLRYESRFKLSDTYVQNYYDNHMEMILYLFPHQIDVLTKSYAKVSSQSCSYMAKYAAGLIRMGKRSEGLSLYKKVFAMVWTDKSTVDDKKNVVDQFIDRLALGYENEQYIDDEIATLLDKQCQKYSDGAWTSKIRMNLGRNKQ